MSGAQERKSPEVRLRDPTSSGTAVSRDISLRAADGTGKLILVVGPSGAGKDTLLSEARRHFSGDDNVVFCERIITRSGNIGEKHISVGETEFEHMAASGGFFLFWDAHGLRYGIPARIRNVLEAGKTVIANVSRCIISEALGKWPDTLIVNVTARRDVLRERLTARGRESAESIEKRLERTFPADFSDHMSMEEIDNSGALKPAAERLIHIIMLALKGS